MDGYLKLIGEARVAMETSEDSWKSSLKLENVSGLNFYEMHTIQTATDNFCISNKLGQGGFGTVYKVQRSSTLLYSLTFLFPR